MTLENPLVDQLVKKVNQCLSIDEKYAHVKGSFKDECIRREILAMVQEGSAGSMDSLTVLATRIDSSLSSYGTRRGKKNKREQLQLSKLDEWYLVQQQLAMEEKESQRRVAQEKMKAKENSQRERKEFLKEVDQTKREQRRRKRDELLQVREDVKKAEKAAARERESKRLLGERLKAERQSQIMAEVKKKEIVSDMRRMADEAEKESILSSLRGEQEKKKQAKMKAKNEMRLVIQENSRYQEEKILQGKADREESKRCMEEYAKILQKQEDERKFQLEKIKQIQSAQEISCPALHTKRWVDDALVNKQAREKEMQQCEQENEKNENLKKSKEEMMRILEKQVEEKLARKAKEKKDKALDKAAMAARHAEARGERNIRLQKAANACINLKNGLDEQIREQRNAIKAKMGMNHFEKCFNAKLLNRAKMAHVREG